MRGDIHLYINRSRVQNEDVYFLFAIRKELWKVDESALVSDIRRIARD